jgi:predicted Zn-dependent protease
MLLVEYSEVQSEETAAPPAEAPAPVKTPVQASEPVQVKRTPPVKEAVPEQNEPDGQDAAPAPRPKGKSKKQRIIELAKAMNEAETEEKDLEEKDQKERTDGRPGNPSDELIEEIRVSKEEIVPESDKQREQMAIINNFIKIQPSITNARERQSHASGDLATIKSGEFGDNIVSETLVEILIRQGKKDKAIEVLKKLIWKYPQKKSYFASQIEDLKK